MYSIFKNSFFDQKPAPKWAFTVEFLLSEKLDTFSAAQSDLPDDAPELLKSIVDKMQKSPKSTRETWMEKLSKSVSKIPVKLPSHEAEIQLFFPGYVKSYTSRSTNAGSIQVTFNDNISRDVRCILEQMMHIDGMDYQTDRDDLSVRPTLPSALRFDMIVRVYDIERVNQYEPTEGSDRVSENGTVQAFKYYGCYVSKLGTDRNDYESTDSSRTVEATIVYQDMREYSGAQEDSAPLDVRQSAPEGYRPAQAQTNGYGAEADYGRKV